jgi:hypothetical protein
MKEVTTSFWGVWYAPMCKDAGELGANAQWRMQDKNQGGAKTIEMLICMKI